MLDFSTVWPLWPAFLKGTLMTVALTLSILVIATPAGFAVAFLRNTRNALVRRVLFGASWVVRGVPPLLVLLIAYFVPTQFGLDLPPFISAVSAMSLYMAFYFGEVFRGGLASIHRGQYEAAQSLGLSAPRTFLRIVLPQLVPAVTPSYVSHASTLLKNTALASAVAVRELTGIGKDLFTVTYRPLETLMLVGVIYCVLSASLFYVQHVVERRAILGGRR